MPFANSSIRNETGNVEDAAAAGLRKKQNKSANMFAIICQIYLHCYTNTSDFTILDDRVLHGAVESGAEDVLARREVSGTEYLPGNLLLKFPTSSTQRMARICFGSFRITTHPFTDTDEQGICSVRSHVYSPSTLFPVLLPAAECGVGLGSQPRTATDPRGSRM